MRAVVGSCRQENVHLAGEYPGQGDGVGCHIGAVFPENTPVNIVYRPHDFLARGSHKSEGSVKQSAFSHCFFAAASILGCLSPSRFVPNEHM